MKPEDAVAYQKRETTVEGLMQTYYPSKLAKKVTPEEYKADNKLSDGRIIDKLVVYKEHDEQRGSWAQRFQLPPTPRSRRSVTIWMRRSSLYSSTASVVPSVE